MIFLKKIAVRENLRDINQMCALKQTAFPASAEVKAYKCVLRAHRLQSAYSSRHGHSCCLSTEAEQCFHFLLIKYSQTSRNFLKWKTSICRFQVVTIDTDTPGKTRRAWNNKDLIYMTEEKTETVANQAAGNSPSVEVCASLPGFLSTWSTLKGLRHLEQSLGASKVIQTSDLVFFYRLWVTLKVQSMFNIF